MTWLNSIVKVNQDVDSEEAFGLAGGARTMLNAGTLYG